MNRTTPQEAYRMLLGARARDAHVDAQWREETLRAAGKTDLDLQRDVTREQATLEASGAAYDTIQAIPAPSELQAR